MKILVVGGGGREHALAWKIGKSPLVEKVYCAPGNPGTALVAENVAIAANDIDGLCAFAKENRIDLTVVGPEEPLCLGIADRFAKAGLQIFGPGTNAARIEGDKAFARDLCRRNRVPSPGYWVFDAYAQANSFLENRPDAPIVVKAAGLAGGKGVTIAANHEEARRALRECLDQRRFGNAGRTVVLEECLSGEELSMIVITDGSTIVPLEPARDHKAVFDGNTGPNTGGMGAFTPVPSVGRRLQRQIENQVLLPIVHGLRCDEIDYRGFLYAGLMLTDAGPRVLEFNCRLGDPETQPLLMRLASDIVPLLLHTSNGTLEQAEPPRFDQRTAVCVVACSEGYPGAYDKGAAITGLDAICTGDDLQVFHSGTTMHDGHLVTAGGRVLAVCALGDGLEMARAKAYDAIRRVDFRGIHFRSDIGSTA